MALKIVMLGVALAAVVVGFALPTPNSTAQPPAQSQIATLDLD